MPFLSFLSSSTSQNDHYTQFAQTGSKGHFFFSSKGGCKCKPMTLISITHEAYIYTLFRGGLQNLILSNSIWKWSISKPHHILILTGSFPRNWGWREGTSTHFMLAGLHLINIPEPVELMEEGAGGDPALEKLGGNGYMRTGSRSFWRKVRGEGSCSKDME